jgi:hypothetical protein
LVPLSHYLLMSVDLIASFLDADGALLLVNGAYASSNLSSGLTKIPFRGVN